MPTTGSGTEVTGYKPDGRETMEVRDGSSRTRPATELVLPLVRPPAGSGLNRGSETVGVVGTTGGRRFRVQSLVVREKPSVSSGVRVSVRPGGQRSSVLSVS